MKRELAAAAALFAVASVMLTLPLGQHPSRMLPSDLQDTLLNTWIIAWDADRLRHGLRWRRGRSPTTHASWRLTRPTREV